MTGTAQIETDVAHAVAIAQDYAARSEQIAIFSDKISTLDLLSGALTESGISFANFRGSMTYEDRCKSVESFNAEGSRVTVLLASRAANEGISLRCTTLLNMEMPDPLRPEVSAQRRARIERVGGRDYARVCEVSALSETPSDIAERFIAAKRALLDSVVVCNQ
jgi:SNF2 family DNA or RNA helicase